MKKNRMMRLASVLLVCVLLTTSVISGTFAKYVTADSGSDSATVAKWGVTVTGIANTLFANTYAKDSETAITNTVSATQDLVAPGTKNEQGVTFSLTGTPEVAVNVKIEVTDAAGTGAPVDVKLVAGTYNNPTGIGDAEFILTEDYHPIEFTLKDGSTTLKTGTLAEIETYLEAANVNKDYAPGTDLSKIFGESGTGTYTLTWAWTFNGNDAADTYLGNETTLQTVSLGIKITATQVD